MTLICVSLFGQYHLSPFPGSSNIYLFTGVCPFLSAASSLNIQRERGSLVRVCIDLSFSRVHLRALCISPFHLRAGGIETEDCHREKEKRWQVSQSFCRRPKRSFISKPKRHWPKANTPTNILHLFTLSMIAAPWGPLLKMGTKCAGAKTPIGSTDRSFTH